MPEGAIEEVIARCLLDPGFAEILRHKPAQALQPYALDMATRLKVESADLEKILRFSGFINKIQHNHLWESFPLTRQLLCYYRIELEVFTAYRPFQLAPDLRIGSLNDKTRSFLNFLDQYIARHRRGGRRYPGLAEALRHERNIWEVSTTVTAAPSEGVLSWSHLVDCEWKVFQNLVPHVNGPIRICMFEVDPEVILEELKRGCFRGRVKRIEQTLFAYRHDAQNGRVLVLKPDRLTVDLLSRVNAKRTIGTVIRSARRTGLAEIPPLAFREFFEQAARSELIHIYAKKG